MKTSKFLKAAVISALVLAITAPMSVAMATESVVDDTVDIKTKTIFDSWVNYPDASIGSAAYNAGWSYDATNDWINTTQNVGWTGFYNPDIDNLTTGQFSFEMQNKNFDPCGFTWGMTKSGTDEDPVYSFYAYEECEQSNASSTPRWSVAYIENWHPAKDTNPHRGPLYHGTIDAKDGSYHHEGTDAKAVGFAEGKVLAFGTLDSSFSETGETLSQQFHKININIEEEKFTISINGKELTTVEAKAQAGSFGPYAVSDPKAYFKNLAMISTNKVMLNPVFEYRNAKDVKINTIGIGEKVSIEDLSTFEGSEITERTWTVTKDEEEIYTGDKPYDKYTEAVGTYVTTLRLKNAYGISSNVYEDTLVVTEDSLTPEFVYADKDGNTIDKAVVGDEVTINDLSKYTGSSIAEKTWKVTLDGTEVYTGTEAYDKYTEKEGTYVTTLVLKNEKGDVSDEYVQTLTVTKPEESSTPSSSTPSSSTPVSSTPASSTPVSSKPASVSSAPASSTATETASNAAAMSTGDSTGAMLPIFAVSAAMAALALVGIKRKKSENK